MEDYFESLYKKLMDQESSLETPSMYTGNNSYAYDDDDGEDFLTSKELVNIDDRKEKSLGLVGTTEGPIEEDVYFKRFRNTYEHKYTQKELDRMRASCVGTIVHDYSENDLYHMSDEYRKEVDMLNEISDKLQKVKGTYRKVDDWIEAMRTVVQAWEILENKGNYVHTEKEFFEMVASGKIVSNRIILPKLKKMNNYDIDTLIKYISNPELDTSDLLPVEQPDPDDWYGFTIEDTEEYLQYAEEYMDSLSNEYIDSKTDDELENEADQYAKDKIEEAKLRQLLSPSEAEYINMHKDDPESFKVKDIKRKLIKGYDKKSFSYGNNKKDKNKKNKIEQYRIDSLHDILNRIQNDSANHSDYRYNRSYLVSNSMFDSVKPPKSFFDDMRLDGSWADKDAMYLYDLAIREEMLKQHPPRSKYMTYGDQELQKFFKLLEENNVNTLDLRRKMDVPLDGGSSTIEEKATKKENKKMESILIQRITKLNNNDKFKKIVSKAEKALNKQFSDY